MRMVFFGGGGKFNMVMKAMALSILGEYSTSTLGVLKKVFLCNLGLPGPCCLGLLILSPLFPKCCSDRHRQATTHRYDLDRTYFIRQL